MHGQDADPPLAAIDWNQLSDIGDGDLAAAALMSEKLIPGVVEQIGAVHCSEHG